MEGGKRIFVVLPSLSPSYRQTNGQPLRFKPSNGLWGLAKKSKKIPSSPAPRSEDETGMEQTLNTWFLPFRGFLNELGQCFGMPDIWALDQRI